MVKKNKNSDVISRKKNMKTPWLNNVMKSLGASTRESIKDIYPNIYEVGSSAADTSKNIVNSLRTNQTNIGRVNSAIESNKYIKAARSAYKNALSDLKSGNLNNTQRTLDYMMGEDSYDSFDESEFSFGNEDTPTNVTYINNQSSQVNTAVLTSVSDQLKKNTEAQIKTQQATMNAFVSISSANMMHIERISGEVIGHLGNISNSLQSIVQYNNDSMSRFIEASLSYYERAGSRLSIDESDENGPIKINPSDVFNGNKGGLKVSAYKDYVKQQMKNAFNNSGAGFANSMLDDDMLQMAATNPIGFMSKGLISYLIPRVMGDTIKTVEDGFSSFVPTMLSKISDWGEEYNTTLTGKLKNIIGKTFGVKNKKESRIDATGSIVKGAIPFDGVTKHAITEIITKELREQTSYLKAIANHYNIDTDKAKRTADVWDYRDGIYKTSESIQEEILTSLKDSIINSFKDNAYDSNPNKNKESFGSQLFKMLDGVEDDKDKKILEKGINELLLNLTDSKKHIDPSDMSEDSEYRKALRGVSVVKKAKNEINRYIQEMRTVNPNAYNDLSRSVIEARNQYNATIKNIAENPSEYNLWASGLNGRKDLGDLINRQFKYGEYEDNHAKLSNKYERQHVEEISHQNGFIGNMFNRASIGFSDQMSRIMSGDATGVVSSFVNVAKDELKLIGNKINDVLINPLKDSIFGKKNGESGKREGGLFSGLNNKLSDFIGTMKWHINGKSWRDSSGNVIAAKDDSVVGNLSKIATTVKTGVMEKLFGKKQLDKNGNPIEERDGNGLVSKFTGSLKEGMRAWQESIFGKPITKKDQEKIKKKAMDTINERMPETMTGAVLGAGGSLLAGNSILGTLVGGPIVGSLMGAALGFASKSEKFQKIVFGEKDEEGNRIGGLVNKKTQDFFKKNKSFLAGGAAIGSVATTLGIKNAGILGNIVGGPIAGALMGLGSSILLKSKTFNKFLFGDNESGQKGIINGIKDAWNRHQKNQSRKNRSTLDAGGKAFGVTAIGTTVGLTAGLIAKQGILGASLGPAGVVGGALAGLALSIKSQGNNFHEWLFGKKYMEDGKEKHHHGIIGQFGNMLNANFTRPLKTQTSKIIATLGNEMEHNILMPFSFVAEDISSSASKLFAKVTDRISTTANNIGSKLFSPTIEIFRKMLVTPITDFMVKASDVVTNTITLPGKVLRASVEIAHNRISELTKPARDLIKDVRTKIFSSITHLFSTITKAALHTLASPVRLLGKGLKWVGGKVADKVSNTKIGKVVENVKDKFNAGGIVDDLGDRIRLNKEEYKKRKQEIKEANLIARTHDKNARAIAKATKNQYSEDTQEARLYAKKMNPRIKLNETIEAEDVIKKRELAKINGRSTQGMSENQMRQTDVSRLSETGQQTHFLAKIWYKLSGKEKEDEERKKEQERLERERLENRSTEEDARNKQHEKNTQKRNTLIRKRINSGKVIGTLNPNGEEVIDIGNNITYTREGLKARGFTDEEIENIWNERSVEFANERTSRGRSNKSGFKNFISNEKQWFRKTWFNGKTKSAKDQMAYNKSKSEYNRLRKNDEVPIDDRTHKVMDFETWAKINHKAYKRGEGYADGTMNATPGIHPINERGTSEIILTSGKPSLRNFIGGEKVLPTDKPLAVYIADVSKETEDKIGGPDESEIEKWNRKDKEDDNIRNSIHKKIVSANRKKAIEDGLTKEEKEKLDEESSKSSTKGKIISTIKGKASSAKESILDFAGSFLSKIKPALMVGGVAFLTKALKIDWAKVISNTSDAITTIAPVVLKIGEGIASVVSVVGKIAGKIGVGISTATENVSEQSTFAKENQSTALDTNTAVGNISKKTTVGISKAAINPRALKTEAKSTKIIGKGIKGVGKASNQLFKKTLPGKVVNGSANMVKKATSSLKNPVSRVKDAVKEATSKKIESVAKVAKDSGNNLFKKASKYIDEFFTKILSKFNKNFGKNVTESVFKFGPKQILEVLKTKWSMVCTKISKVLGEHVTAATVSAGLIEVGFITAGAINGASGTAKLFQVKSDEVDDTMKSISTILGGFSGSTVGAVFDIVNEIIYSVKGVDLYNTIACTLYRLIKGDEKYTELKENQKEFKEDYKNDKDTLITKQYETQKKAGIISKDVSLDDFKSGVEDGTYKAKYESFEDYNKRKNASIADKVATGTKKAWSSYKKAFKFVNGGINTSYKDENGNTYTKNDDGTYQITDDKGNDLGFISKDSLPENLTKKRSVEANIFGKAIVAGANITAKAGKKLNKYIPVVSKKADQVVASVGKRFTNMWDSMIGNKKKNNTKTQKDVVYYLKEDGYMTYYKKDTSGNMYTKYNMDGSIIEKNITQDTFDSKMDASLLKEGTISDIDKDNENVITDIKKSFKSTMNKVKDSAKKWFEKLKDKLNKNDAIDDDTDTTTNKKSTGFWGKLKSVFSGGGSGNGNSPITKSNPIHGGRGDMLNGFQYYSQNDSSWGNHAYGNDGATMKDTGCGPTAMSMVATQLTGKDVKPTDAADLAQKTGDRDETGTNWNYINKASDAYGLSSSMKYNPSESDMISQLASGNPMILSGTSGGNGDSSAFTPAGHYVVATGIDKNGNVNINDPRGKEYSGKKSIHKLTAETNIAWSFNNRGGRGGSALRKLFIRGGRGGSEVSADDVVKVAVNEIGYLEKATNSNLDDKSANPGKNNYTKYGLLTGTNGNYWCASFVSWCFYTACGNDRKAASKLLCGNLSASADAIRQCFMKNNQYDKTPKVGDCIFFSGSRHSGANHIGIVVGVDGDKVITVEGNTSSEKGVADNGGAVAQKSYSKGYNRILGYGHPAYGSVASINITSDGGVSSSSSEPSTSSSSPDLFSSVSSILGSAAKKAFNGLTTGKFDTDFSSEISAATNTGTTSENVSDSSSTSSADGIVGSSTAEKVWNYFTKCGYSKQATAGILGNLQQESGVDPTRIQAGAGHAAGIAQWESYKNKSGRWKSMKDYAESKGHQWTDLEPQLEFIDKELKGLDYYFKNKANTTYEKWKHTTSVKDGVEGFEKSFERAGKPNMENRIKAANKFYGLYGGGSGNGIKRLNVHQDITSNKNGGYGVSVTGKPSNNYTNSTNAYKTVDTIIRAKENNGVTDVNVCNLLSEIVGLLSNIASSTYDSSTKLDMLKKLGDVSVVRPNGGGGFGSSGSLVENGKNVKKPTNSSKMTNVSSFSTQSNYFSNSSRNEILANKIARG